MWGYAAKQFRLRSHNNIIILIFHKSKLQNYIICRNKYRKLKNPEKSELSVECTSRALTCDSGVIKQTNVVKKLEFLEISQYFHLLLTCQQYFFGIYSYGLHVGSFSQVVYSKEKSSGFNCSCQGGNVYPISAIPL